MYVNVSIYRVVTVEVPKSSQSLRISPEQENSLGYGLIMEMVSFERLSPRRTVACTKAKHDPEEITPLSKYSPKVGTYLLLNHFASVR